MLKEITIIFFLSLSYLFLIKERFIFCIMCLLITSLIKPYMVILFGLVYVLYFILIYFKPKLEHIYISLIVISILCLFNVDLLINLVGRVNTFIYNFNLEGSGYTQEGLEFTRNLLKFDFNSLSYIISSIFLYLFKPILFEVKNIPQFLQSLENILIFIVLIYFLRKLYFKNILKTYYIISSIFIVSLPYAIIVSNVGTLSRYRFTIIMIFLLITFFELNQPKIKNEK